MHVAIKVWLGQTWPLHKQLAAFLLINELMMFSICNAGDVELQNRTCPWPCLTAFMATALHRRRGEGRQTWRKKPWVASSDV